MRPVLTAWLAHHGLPTWLAPDYFQLAVLAAFLGSFLALRFARRDGASTKRTAHAVACAYVGSLLGGYIFESMRAFPAALWTGHWHAVLYPGRAAYGGLLAGAGAAVIYLRAKHEPVAPFFDRVAVATGLTFALVRTGCFLAGCDYGAPTGHTWGVRFPPGSLAAVDHARRGFVRAGAASLPVHATQLYEAGLGLVAALLSAIPLARGRRNGSAFLTFLVCYASGRFAIELLRGDHERGRLAGLSTAQWVSLALLMTVVVLRHRGRARQALAKPRATRMPVDEGTGAEASPYPTPACASWTLPCQREPGDAENA